MNACSNKSCCREMIHTAEVKVCKICHKEITNGNCRYCAECTAKIITDRDGSKVVQCGHCGHTSPVVFSDN